MAQTITKGYQALLDEANSLVSTISVDEAATLLGSDKHVFIDLRDIRELQRAGKIPGAFSCPRGMLEFWIDPESPYHKEVFAQEGKRYVFHCASGWRSALSVATLQDMGFEAAHLKEGFGTWEKQGGPVEFPPKKDG